MNQPRTSRHATEPVGMTTTALPLVLTAYTILAGYIVVVLVPMSWASETALTSAYVNARTQPRHLVHPIHLH